MYPKIERPIPLGSLRFEEHIRGCTVYWKKPPEFDNLGRDAYRQQIVIHEIPSNIIIKHTLVNPQIEIINFKTIDGRAYDIQISLFAEINGNEVIARGCLKIIAAKYFALGKRKKYSVNVIQFNVIASSIHCLISWTNFYESFKGGFVMRLRLWCDGRCNEILVKPKMDSFAIRTYPGRKYFFEIRVFNANKNRLIAAGDTWFRAIHSQNELSLLCNMAENYCKSIPAGRFQYFYRTKPKEYFDDCMKDGEIMHIYTKDESGHPSSPLNGQLDGLFFLARLNTNGTYPQTSPFGDTRWFTKAENLFHPDSHRLYFADFYCSYRTHYVTIVICEMGSDADKFCQHYLIELAPQNNNFFEIRFSEDNIYYFTNMKIWVEIYYTGNLPLSLGNFKEVIPRFQGTSTIGGIPNNKNCHHCNLYPEIDLLNNALSSI